MKAIHPTKRFPTNSFATYDWAAQFVRETLGVSRLSPKLAAQVREAVAKHVVRADRKASPVAPPVIARLRRQIESEVSESSTLITGRLYRDKGYSPDRITIGPEPRAHTSAPTQYVSGRNGFGNVVTSTTFNITVMPAWRRRVLAVGIARLDGLFTTHAYPVLVDGEIVVYRAAWVRQKAGYNIESESGFLAHHSASGMAYHLASSWASPDGPECALRGLRRKLKQQSIPTDVRDAQRAERDRQRDERRSAAIAKLAGQLSRLDISEVGHVVVSRSDSLRAGNCVPGTDEFIERFAPGRESVTIAELANSIGRENVAELAGNDLTLARQLGAAVLVAVRRNRNARRLVGA